MRYRYNAVNFLTDIHKNTHSSPVRVRYGVKKIYSASGKYSAAVPVDSYVMNKKTYNIGPRYKGTGLYILVSFGNR